MLALMPIQISDIHDDVNVVCAHLVNLHIDWSGVAGNVDLGENVEEIRFGHAAVVDKSVHEIVQGIKVRDELLNDFAECLENGIVVDGGHVVADIWVDVACVVQVVPNTLCNILIDFRSEIIVQAVNFVNEDFNIDLREGALKVEDGGGEAIQGIGVIVLCIDDPYKGADL